MLPLTNAKTALTGSSLQYRNFYYLTYYGPILHFWVTFYSAYGAKCDLKEDYGTIKSWIVKVSLALQIQSSQCQANDSFDRFDWTCWKWTNNGTAQEEEARPVVRKPMLTSPLSNAKTKLAASFRNLGSPIHSPQCQPVNLMTQGASQSAYWLVYFEGYVFHSATLKNTIRKLFQIDFVDNDFTSKSM